MKSFPINWKTQLLRNLATINYGKSPNDILSEDGEYPVVGTGGVERFGRGYLFDGESIVLGRKGTIDKVTYINSKFWTIDTAYYLSGTGNISVKWLYYYLSAFDLASLNEATGVPSLSRDRLYEILVDTPDDINEQTKIAEILSTVDKAIEQTEAIITKQQRIKTGLMQDLLTKGIDENGNIRSEETHEFKDSPLGRIPVEWDVDPLSSLVDEPITYGIVQAGPHLEDGVPYIRTGDMSGDEIVLESLLRTSPVIAKSFKRSAVFEGDIVFALRSTVGKVLPVSCELSGCNLTQGTAKISPKDSVCSCFLLWVLRSDVISSQIFMLQKGTTFSEITLGDLRGLAVPIPFDIEEQKKIALIFENQNEVATESVRVLQKLKRFKTALMQDLLTGDVSVANLLDEQSAI